LSNRQAIIIGLDGATFDLINPLVASGRLPIFSRLLTGGVRAQLMSTIPPATVPAWPTFMTGKHPGRHGVFDFFKQVDGGQRRLISSQDINGPTLWRYLSDQGRRCIVLNVPCTYPPEPINGVLASGMLTPANGQHVHPPEMAAQLDAWTGGYRTNPRSKYVGDPFNREELIQELYEVSNIQKNAFLALLQAEPWDLAMLMFPATDIIQHKLWHEQIDIAAMYEFMDGILAEIVARAGNASIWLVSDHGFGPLKKQFHINKWLRDQGWLAIRLKVGVASAEGKPSPRAGQERSAMDTSLQRAFSRVGLSRDRARALLPPSVQTALKRLLPHKVRRLMPASAYEVDWLGTQVFSDSSFTQETQALRINLRGREPAGTVAPDEYAPFRDQVIQALKELSDPETGELVVTDVYKGDELFAGPYADAAPDLILQLDDGYKMIGGFVAREYISSLSPVSGSHRRDGILVASGPDIAIGADLGPISIADVMPTLLHWMGLPVPSTCDGQVQPGVFAPASESANQPVSFEDVAAAPQRENVEPGEIDEQVLARLQALGYLG